MIIMGRPRANVSNARPRSIVSPTHRSYFDIPSSLGKVTRPPTEILDAGAILANTSLPDLDIYKHAVTVKGLQNSFYGVVRHVKGLI